MPDDRVVAAVVVARGERRIDGPENIGGRFAVCANHDSVRMQEVRHRRAFA